jgi:hypothetical protein
MHKEESVMYDNPMHIKPNGTSEAPPPDADETLVLDKRATLSPAQAVDRKLQDLLRETPLPVSRLPLPDRPAGRFPQAAR